MSRLTRFTQLIFGSNASSAQMAQYGSFAAGTPATYSGTTITPALVQSLGNYLSGWFSAVLGQNSPAIEDMNSLCYLFAYQLSYLMQAGVPEWDAGTTYYTGDIVQILGTTYTSIVDNNLNNAVTLPSFWAQPVQNGLVIPSTMATSATIASGNTLAWPVLTVGSLATLNIATGAVLYADKFIIVSGTLIVNGTGYIS